ncbi:metallophosphoesterase [Acinetobacter bereziniae]|uniref:Calcineurin-like phosphoesterase domain-containing protein n=1 Tax=Acinetobacter bereziniae NIPH 3 TaxID=1217651 RepID=N8XAB9_ACIBZ|nr:metallophosphoesterase [Acinetobacter bereziniae]ENV21231.1 hypothetical protein F963_02823 [Acinetobacter bereziniae NIPH 3]
MKSTTLFLSLFSIIGNSLAQERYEPVTEPIGLFADTQEHERHGTFTFIAGKTVDKITKVAARSPQIDFYNKYAIEDILENFPLTKGSYFVHLGDMLDISCNTEWKRSFNVFLPAINNGKLVLGLGNHDGFYVGNYAFDTHNGFSKKYIGPASWRDRCDTGFKKISEHNDSYKTIMDKSKIIINFQNFITQTGKVLLPIKNSNYCHNDMLCSKANINNHWTSYFQIPRDVTLASSGFGSSGIKNFWRSYMVSEVKLPMKNENISIKLIILDPSQSDRTEQSTQKTIFNQLHLLSRSNILFGHIQQEQRKLVEHLVTQPCQTKACFYILSGHHPLKDYESSNYEWISKLIKSNPQILPLYLSAHTHKGFIKAKNKINELNIGSFIENDPKFRTIQIFKEINNNNFIVQTNKIAVKKYFEISAQ